MWLTDPKTKDKSVSLTLLMISFVGIIISGSLEISGIVNTTSVLPEIFYGCCATYFGRRIKFGNKEFGENLK